MPSASFRIVHVAGATLGALAIALAIDACTSLDGLTGPVETPAEAGAAADGPTTGTGTSALGKPCVRNTECTSGLCVAIGADDGGIIRSVCSATCEKPSDCTAGWSCVPSGAGAASVCQCTATPEQCDGKDNDCNAVVDDQAAEACKVAKGGTGWACTNAACACAGTTCPATDAGAGGCADLTGDPLRCGSCDLACPTGGMCIASKCRCSATAGPCPTEPGAVLSCGEDGACHAQLRFGSGGVPYFGVNATDVVYSKILESTVYRVGKSGGTPATVVVASSTVVGIAVDDARLAILTTTGLKTCTLPGCTGAFDLAVQASAIATHAGVVYWILSSNGSIEARPHDGSGTTVEIFPKPAAGSGSGYLAVDSSGVYVAYADGSIYTIGLGGGSMLLASGQSPPRGLALDADRFYVPTAGGVLTCAKSPQLCQGAPAFLVTGAINAVTADAAHVYWSTSKGIYSCSAGQCKPTQLVAGTDFGIALHQQDDSVYFSASTGVGRVTK